MERARAIAGTPGTAAEAADDAALFAGDRTPVDELLRHVAEELRRLCAAAHEIEAIVSPLITDRGEKGLQSLQGLQELDRLIQHIEGLGDYLGALAEAAEGLGAVDAGAAAGQGGAAGRRAGRAAGRGRRRGGRHRVPVKR